MATFKSASVLERLWKEHIRQLYVQLLMFHGKTDCGDGLNGQLHAKPLKLALTQKQKDRRLALRRASDNWFTNHFKKRMEKAHSFW